MKDDSVHMIWTKDSYIANIPTLFNRTIVEYDLKAANISLAKEYELLDKDEIDRIEKLPKQERVIAIGLIQRDDKFYKEKEKMAFAAARKKFIDTNHIEDVEIHAIRKDAIYVLRYVKEEQVGGYLQFRMKNEYTSYLNLQPLHVYYNKMNGLDIKGISDEIYGEFHKEYFGAFLYETIRMIESGDTARALKKVRIFYDSYKIRKLDVEYYREFNAASLFRYIDGELSKSHYRDNVSELDISFNLQLIIKLVNYLI